MNDQLEQASGQPTPTKSALNKGLIFGLVAVIVVLLVAVIYLLTTKPAVSPVVVNDNLTKNQEQIVDNNQSPTADWKTYKNEKYGFELTLTDAWKGYTVKFDDGLLGDGGSQTLRFYVPTKDPKYSGDLAGYASPFRITVYLKSAWQAVLDDSPHPTYITEKDGYVFTYSQWQDAPTDLQNKNFEIPKILSTFKFNN